MELIINRYNKHENTNINLTKGVYFIYAPNQNKVKIGRSTKIEKRFRELKTGFMDEGLLLAGILSKNEVKLENEIHSKFQHLRINGEWFLLTKELDDFLINLRRNYLQVIMYDDINIIKEKFSFSTLGVYNLIVILKNIQNKYIVPLFLSLLGLIISFYDLAYTPSRQSDFLPFMLKYMPILFYPILTPYLTKKIIENETVLNCIFYFLILFAIVCIEILNILYPLSSELLAIMRVLVLCVFISYSKYFLYKLQSLSFKDLIRNKINDRIDQFNSNSEKAAYCLSVINKNETRKKVHKKIHEYTMALSIGISYPILTYFIFITDLLPYNLKINSALFVWLNLAAFLVLHLMPNKSEESERIKRLIIPVSIFIIEFIPMFISGKLWLYINTLLITCSLPFLIISIYLIYLKTSFEIQYEEIKGYKFIKS